VANPEPRAASGGPVLRLRGGDRWIENPPPWSRLSDMGWFRLSEQAFRFDCHFHDCDEYWVVVEGQARIRVGDAEYDAAPGDVVCTPAGTMHDVLACNGTDLLLVWFEGELPPGGRPGHLHEDEAAAKGHEVPRPCRSIPHS
jgi:mannose-6-phosphate isomerase-like protein (cupin superfamily)